MNGKGIYSWLTGPPAYISRTPWKPLSAIGAVALVLLTSRVLFPLIIRSISDSFSFSELVDHPVQYLLELPPLLKLAQQVIDVAFIWFLAGAIGGKRVEVLSLNQVKGGARTLSTSTCVVLTITMPIVFVVSLSGFGDLGLAPFNYKPTAAPPNNVVEWMIFAPLIFVVGAPLSEEL